MQKGRVGSWVCSEMECFNNVNFLLLVWYFTCFISLFSLLFDVFVSSNNFDNGLGNMGKGIGCGLLGWKYKSGNVKSSDLSQLLSLSFLNQALLPFCTVNLSLQHISIRMLNEVSVNYRKKVGRLTHGQVNPTKEWNFYNCFLICSLLVKKVTFWLLYLSDTKVYRQDHVGSSALREVTPALRRLQCSFLYCTVNDAMQALRWGATYKEDNERKDREDRADMQVNQVICWSGGFGFYW